MQAYVEHANLNVRSLDEAVKFLTTALPEFKVRGSGINNGLKWLHIGTDSSYLALNESTDAALAHAGAFNHIGFAVPDVASIKNRLLDAGYSEGFKVDPNPNRKRLYFLDHDGLEWEFVEYLSDDVARRNEYDSV